MNFPNFDEYLKVSEKLDTSIFGFEVWNNVNEDSDGLPKDKNEALEKAKRIVELVKLKVTKNFEWFKPYLDIMPIVPRFGAGSVGPDGVGTMATNGAEIFYDPIFVLRQYEKGKVDFAKEITAEIQKAGPIKANFKGWKWWSDYVCFVIIHEIMHNSLKHFKRSSKIVSDYLNENEIHTLWNLAQDYEINRIIANQTDVPLPLPQGVVYHKSGPFAVPADEQDFYEKSTSERIFWRLFRNIENERKKSFPQPQQGQQGQGQQGQGQQGQGQQGQGQQGQGQGQQSQPQQGQQGNQPQQGKSGGGQGRRQVQVGDKVKIKRTGKIGVVKSVNPDGTFDIDVEPVNEAVFPKDFFTYLDSITGSYNRDEFIPISDDSNNGGDDEGEESGDQEASGEEQGEGGSEEGDEGENNGNGQQGSKKGKGDEGEEDYDENSNERIGKSEETDLDDDKLDNEYVNKIEGAIKDDSWDIGNPTANVGGSAGEAEERVWDISKIDNDIDEANRKVGRMEAEREEKTKSEKGRGKGEGSTFRDRIVIEGLARVNWGAIFKTRLTEYSKDKAKRIPYHKKFVGNKMLRPRITSKSYAKDVLPETNILIDTSSSLSYRELGVILNEIKNSVTYAKIKKVNLILWHTRAYYTNSYSNVDSKVMMKMMMDINQHWQGGGTELVSAYRKMKQKGWTNKFTIILSDGWVEDHKTDSEAKRLAAEVLDLNNTISGVIFPNKSVSMSDFKKIADRMPGEKIPIFLDTDRFS